MLVLTTSKRSPELPDVPTVAESGYPGFDAPAWWAILAPAKTPPEIVRRMNEEVNKALKVPDIANRLGSQGIAIVGGTPETAHFHRPPDRHLGAGGEGEQHQGGLRVETLSVALAGRAGDGYCPFEVGNFARTNTITSSSARYRALRERGDRTL